MTLAQLTHALGEIRDDNPRLLAAMIFEEWGGCTCPADLTDTSELWIPESQIDSLLRDYAEGVPFGYLLGCSYFWRGRFKVRPGVLIPRADTECLVEQAVKLLPHGAVFADLGTGSGCIAISVLMSRPDTTAIALEIDPRNAELARENAEANGVSDRLTVVCGDMLGWMPRQPLDAVLSNPPYIAADVLPTLDKYVGHEPRTALDGGEDGLDFYRVLVRNVPLYINKDGFCAYEIGYDQAGVLRELSESHGLCCRILKDYGGCDRVAVLTLK